jgi:hypothetical protein
VCRFIGVKSITSWPPNLSRCLQAKPLRRDLLEFACDYAFLPETNDHLRSKLDAESRKWNCVLLRMKILFRKGN